jgi:hypothetical protein
MHKFASTVALACCTVVASMSALADDYGNDYAVMTSLWTTHWSPQPYHNNDQRLIGLERFGSNFATRPLEHNTNLLNNATPLLGATLFRNSFDQRSTYAYTGFRQQVAGNYRTQAYVKLTAGVLHGYRGEHRDKIPFNRFGVTVAAIPSMGIQHRRMNAEAVLFGTAGLMLNIGYTF